MRDGQTLVTCLYDLESREGQGRGPISRWQEWGAYVLGLDAPLVLFADAELGDWALSRRQPGSRTHLVRRPLEDFELHALLPRTRELPTFANCDPVKDTPLYQVLTWSKLDMVRQAMAENPFGTGHFAWIDVGIGKIARPPERFPAPCERVGVLQMKAVAPREVATGVDFYRYERGTIAGGFFRGSAAALHELSGLFRTELFRVLDGGLRPNEQCVLGALTARHSELFEFHYGDYASILQNWDHVRADLTTVFWNLAHCRAEELWEHSLRIGDRVEESVRAGAIALTSDQRAQLLDERFIAAWYGGQLDLARLIKAEFDAGLLSTAYALEHRDRLRANLALL